MVGLLLHYHLNTAQPAHYLVLLDLFQKYAYFELTVVSFNTTHRLVLCWPVVSVYFGKMQVQLALLILRLAALIDN